MTQHKFVSRYFVKKKQFGSGQLDVILTKLHYPNFNWKNSFQILKN